MRALTREWSNPKELVDWGFELEKKARKGDQIKEGRSGFLVFVPSSLRFLFRESGESQNQINKGAGPIMN